MGWLVLGGVIVAVAALATVSIVADWCPSSSIAMVQLLLPWWTVLTVVTGVVAAVGGTWPLGFAGLVVAGAALAVLRPKLRRSRRRRALHDPGAGARRCRIALANLYIDNDAPEEAIAQLFEANPDVLVMTELSVDLLARFDRVGGAERFPNRVHPEPIHGEYAVGIFTAHGVDSPSVWDAGELQVVEATVRLEGARPLRVIAVHPEAPVGAEPFRRWRHQLGELGRVLAEAEGPTIALGDLNSGTLQPPYERLLRSQFDDAHDLLGVALRPSWGVAPWFPRWFPTLLARLDHLLVSREVGVARLDDLDAVGSDHRPFLAELDVPAGDADTATT